MSCAQPFREALRGLRHSDEVDVVVHQTIGPVGDPGFIAVFLEQAHIELAVLIAEKHLLPAIPTLHDMMGQIRNDHPGNTWHWLDFSDGQMF
jgi:hypothetical protein